ncbi:unnamed protein product [Caenorhabditis brenneri]
MNSDPAMAHRLKLLFALILVMAFWPLHLGAPLTTPPVDGEAPPTDCSMPTPAPLAMTTVAPPTVSTTWDAPPTTHASAQSVQAATAPPTVTFTTEAPPTQSPVEEEPCEVDVDDVPLLT